MIIGRVLAAGAWKHICWLLGRLSRPELCEWLVARNGAGLSARQLRFWELIAKVPRHQVDAWLADPARKVWEGR